MLRIARPVLTNVRVIAEQARDYDFEDFCYHPTSKTPFFKRTTKFCKVFCQNSMGLPGN